MDQKRFDDLTVKLTKGTCSRRATLKGLAASALGLALGAIGIGEAGATHFNCRHVGKPCTRKGQCCSGICRGPSGKKTCRGHGAGTCKQQGQELICTAPDHTLSRCDNDVDCDCIRTTAGTNYCADFVCRSEDSFCSVCAACERDADCLAQGFPEGSACAPATIGRCIVGCESDTFCVVPCGFDDPPTP